MTDLSDVNMEGVTPPSEFKRLPPGTYLIRVEDTEKKQVQKEKFDESGNKLPPEYMLLFHYKVYGGPNDGQEETDGLNLWNHTPEYVGYAKSTLKAIQLATGVATPKSDDFHGKWMILEIKAGIKDPTKLYKHYSVAPASMVSAYAHIPPVPAKLPIQAAAAQPAHVAATMAAAPVAAANQLPAWAAKRTA